MKSTEKPMGERHNNARLLTRWTWCVTVAGALAVVVLFDEYGITWDEAVQARYGELVVAYFKSGFSDRRCNEFLNLRFYGPFFETLCAVVYSDAGDWKFEVRHLCTGLVGLLIVPGVIRFARCFSRPGVACFSSLTVLMLPRLVGHAFTNSKDIPFACGFVWSMAF